MPDIYSYGFQGLLSYRWHILNASDGHRTLGAAAAVGPVLRRHGALSRWAAADVAAGAGGVVSGPSGGFEEQGGD